MENIKAYKNQIEEVQNLVNQLEDGSLSKEGLTKLESLTRMIHERSVILKYIAFAGVTDVQSQNIEEKKQEASISFESPKEEKVEIDLFGDFPKKEEEVETPHPISDIMDELQKEEPNFVKEVIEKELAEKVVNEMEEIDLTEKVVEEMEQQDLTEKVIEEMEEMSPTEAEEELAPKTFLEQLKLEDDSLHSMLSVSKIETLIGAFSLNEKLRFMNDLFDGSSEDFNDSLKMLDSLSGQDEANQKINELAKQFEWEIEDEAVAEFVTFINRRYA